jgi:type IV fimbrial biogenesis protein FimT
MPPQQNAYTLVELVVTMAIASMVLAAGIPSLVQVKTYAETRSASHILSTSLASARVLAVMQGVPFTVCPVGQDRRCRDDGVWDEGWIVFRDATRAGQPTRAADVVSIQNPAPGTRIRSTSGRAQVRFLPLGHATGSNLTLTVCSGRRRAQGARVVMGNSGRVRTERIPAGHPDCADA